MFEEKPPNITDVAPEGRKKHLWNVSLCTDLQGVLTIAAGAQTAV